MATMKIENAERVEEVSGEEVVPVSKGGAPKSLTVEQVKDYVAKAVSQASDGTFDASTDRLAISRKDSQGNQSVVRCTLDDVANALYKSVGEIPEEGIVDVELANAKLVIYDTDDSKTVKSVTFNGLAKWMLDGFEESVKFDIGSLDEVQLVDDPARTFFAAKVAGAVKHVKISFANVVRKFKSMLFESDESTVNSQTDSVIVSDTYGHVSKRTLKTLGIFDFIRKPNMAGRDLTGFIPRFASRDGSSFDAHYTVADSVGSDRTDQIPTSAAVATAIDEKFADAGNVKRDGGAEENDIVAFAKDWKIKSSGKKVVTSIGEDADDASIPTAKAVAEAVENADEHSAKIGETATSGKLAKVGLDGKTLEGVEIKGLSLDLTDPSDEKIVTEKAVVNSVKGSFLSSSSAVATGYVVEGDDNARGVKAVRKIVDEVNERREDPIKEGSDIEVPTTRYVQQEISKIVGDTSVFHGKKLLVYDGRDGVYDPTRKVACASPSRIMVTYEGATIGDVLTFGAIAGAFSAGKFGLASIPGEVPENPVNGSVRFRIVDPDSENPKMELMVYDASHERWYVFMTTSYIEAN